MQLNHQYGVVDYLEKGKRKGRKYWKKNTINFDFLHLKLQAIIFKSAKHGTLRNFSPDYEQI